MTRRHCVGVLSALWVWRDPPVSIPSRLEMDGMGTSHRVNPPDPVLQQFQVQPGQSLCGLQPGECFTIEGVYQITPEP